MSYSFKWYINIFHETFEMDRNTISKTEKLVDKCVRNESGKAVNFQSQPF